MSQINELPDDELRVQAQVRRRAALRGEINAHGHAHEHEAELRRRYGPPWRSRPPNRDRAGPPKPPTILENLVNSHGLLLPLLLAAKLVRAARPHDRQRAKANFQFPMERYLANLMPSSATAQRVATHRSWKIASRSPSTGTPSSLRLCSMLLR